ncbi:hypothetical protein DD238_001700 [Peronospora effusa]|uniref:CTLH domain-containing protein n=1 Tax=Peronospora effusa TaxID=542832 RepID=A0A3M6VWF9_9STRA|nr:hypothetical protein DD238_001700 [Peronospora effusa]
MLKFGFKRFYTNLSFFNVHVYKLPYSVAKCVFASFLFFHLIRSQKTSSTTGSSYFEMETLEEESRRVLKKQRVCVAQINRQLDELLMHVDTTKQQLEARQKDLCRKKNRQLKEPLLSLAENEEKGSQDASNNEATQSFNDEKTLLEVAESSYNAEELKIKQEDVGVEEQDNETECILKDFIYRVQQLNIEKNVASELKAIHILLSKFSKHIDKNLCTDIAKVCGTNKLDQKLVWRLVAEYLYQDGQIEAADTMCKEAGLKLPPAFRESFIELHQILKAIKEHDIQPALDWARKHRRELGRLDIDIEFELVRHKYVDILESSPDMMDAVSFANKELPYFHQTHSEGGHKSTRGYVIKAGVPLVLNCSFIAQSCVLFKGKLEESPYKKLFNDDRWKDIYDAHAADFVLFHTGLTSKHGTPCANDGSCVTNFNCNNSLSAGIPALPAMRKLASVMDGKLADWASIEELPVEIPIAKELRFHNVFSCPVSKEESTPDNPPTMLKCGHVICRSCVDRFSYNMTRFVVPRIFNSAASVPDTRLRFRF